MDTCPCGANGPSGCICRGYWRGGFYVDATPEEVEAMASALWARLEAAGYASTTDLIGRRLEKPIVLTLGGESDSGGAD